METPVLPQGRHARLLDALPAIAWSASAHTFRFNYINPAAETILGYPASRWLEEPMFWSEHLHPEDAFVVELCHTATMQRRHHELEYRMIAADGRTVWLRDYVHVHSVEGEPVELFGVMVDITREREAEAAWKESRENFRRMVELSPDCIGVQVGGEYVYVNRAFLRLFGAESEDAVVGRHMLELLHGDYHEQALEQLARVAAGGTEPYAPSKFRRVDGTYVDVEVAALPLRYGNRDAVQVIARDITGRLRAEEELRTREARLQLLASGTHEALWEWFPERDEIWMNDACRQLLGEPATPDAFLACWLERVHPDDRERAESLGRCAIHGGSPSWQFEYRMRGNDGTERVVLDRGHCVKSADGEQRLIGSFLDVTSLREAEHLRAQAEAKFRWIVEEAVVAVYMMSGDRFTYANDTAARMLGYTAQELLSLDPASLLYGGDRPSAVFAGNPNVARLRRKDGTPLYIAFYPSEVVVDDEKITIGTAADISDTVYAQQALEVSERRYRELVEGVNDILYTADDEGLLVSLSGAFERISGYRVEEWIGRPFAELFRLPSAPHPAHSLREQAGEGSGMIPDYELATRSGAVVMLEVVSQPRYVDGVACGTIGMARDVTGSRTIARKLEDAKRMSSLGQLAASLAHEFNNVLMGIQPFVEVIGRHASGPRVGDALGHITRAIARGKRASQEVLRFAKPKEPQLSAIDASPWLSTFLRQLAAALPGSITLHGSTAPDVRYIRGDQEHLEQVITNLVFNARDAMPAGGTIRVSLSRAEHAPRDAQGDFVRISICDDGPGIASEVLDRIFEPLFTTKRNGTGLGLPIARRLIEGQGGALTAENLSEGGCAFHIFVPMPDGATPAAPAAERAAPAVTRVLLVEDDPSAGAGIEELLRAEGFETTWVRLAGEACAAAERTQPQVAIIDVNLPDGNGVDLVPLLRAGGTTLPIVLSTGHVELNISDENDRILSLMKPYELSDLLAAIANVTKAA